MSKQQQAEDKISTALLLLSAAADMLFTTIEEKPETDYTPEDQQTFKRMMQIHAAVSFLVPDTNKPNDHLPISRDLPKATIFLDPNQ